MTYWWNTNHLRKCIIMTKIKLALTSTTVSVTAAVIAIATAGGSELANGIYGI